ncbi:MAG: twin-arginine translocase TatA/TatE family subunit [Bacteroidales bacterium]|nr:twin-arginine translocase TatA/TatE family subunit [Bacteroidales bacterium]
MNTQLILGAFGPTEIILIILALLLLFGGRKIPELMKGLGQGMREFKKAQRDEPEERHAHNNNKSINPESDNR